MQAINERFSCHCEVSSVSNCLVRIGARIPGGVPRLEFVAFINELIKDQSILFFTVQETSLDQVFTKLI